MNKKRIYGNDYVPLPKTEEESDRVMKLYKSVMKIIDYILDKPIETNASTTGDVRVEKHSWHQLAWI